MTIRLAHPLQKDSIVDGEGLRMVIWAQGCSHHCPGCHNPETHSFKGGFLQDIEELKNQIKASPNQDGVTLSGGDPFFQIEASLEIAKFSKGRGLNVWAYTGYTFEQLMVLTKNNENLLQLLKHLDVLIDGKFDIAQKSLDCKFRGSKNQRIIDVKESLLQQKAIIIKKYDQENLALEDPRIYI